MGPFSKTWDQASRQAIPLSGRSKSSVVPSAKVTVVLLRLIGVVDYAIQPLLGEVCHFAFRLDELQAAYLSSLWEA